METLFSTVAQISFAIVGLFFVAVTLDSDSRNYWFDQFPQNRYVYLNFLVMLIPGFLSLGGLVSVGDGVFPSWPYAGLILFVYCLLIYFELKKLKKVLGYKSIADLESRLNISGIAFSNALILLLLSIFGFSSAYVQDLINLGQQEVILKSLICFSIFDSVLPVIIFPRDFAKSKVNAQVTNVNSIGNSLNMTDGHYKKPESVYSFFILVAALIAFLIGKFYSKD